MKFIYITLLSIVFLSSCGIKISGEERRRLNKIRGDATDVSNFTRVMANGKIINEDTAENYRFIIVKKVPSDKPYLFIEEMQPRRSLDGDNYKRRFTVYQLSDNAKTYFAIDESKTALLSKLPLAKICNFINGSSLAKDFTLFEVFGQKSDKSTAPYHALFINKIPCSGSRILTLDNAMTAKEGYENNLITCNPNSPADSLIYAIKDGKIIFWNDTINKPVTKPAAKNPAETKDTEQTKGYSFTHACNNNFNFLVTIFSEKDKRSISVHNNIESVPVSYDTTPGRGIDSTVKQLDTVKKGDTIYITKKIAVRDALIIKQVIKVKDTSYKFSSRFDDINFTAWLHNQYPKLDETCADYLAYKVTEELLWHDTAYLKCKYCPAVADDKKKEDDKDKKALATVKRGAATIVNTIATVMNAVYSDKQEKNNALVSLQFKVTGKYDSSANTIPLEIDSVLSSKIKLTDTSVTISEDEWNTALASDGIIKKQIKVSYSALKDTIKTVQSSFISIKGQSDEGQHEIQLTPSQFNPNKPFWIEIGSNFDLADGLEPNNFFSGVFFHKRDIRPISKRKKQNNIGLFAGVYESKSVTITGQVDSIRNYYNDQSLALVDSNRNVGIFKDSGTIQRQNVVRNVSLFFSPQLRLSNGSANENGMHFFVSLWAELQWQRISNESDFSNLKRVDTFFTAPGNLNSFSQQAAQKKDIDIKTHYYGIGIPMYFKEDDVNVFFNPVFGISNQPSEAKLNTVFSKRIVSINNDGNRKWSPFYVFQFRLNEEKYGIAFTGEVRGLLKQRSAPFVSMALTKKFDLSKFIEFQK